MSLDSSLSLGNLLGHQGSWKGVGGGGSMHTQPLFLLLHRRSPAASQAPVTRVSLQGRPPPGDPSLHSKAIIQETVIVPLHAHYTPQKHVTW